MVLDDSGGSSIDISMDVQVILLHVSLEKELILLSITACKHKVVLTRDKPVEFFKPVHFAYLFHFDSLLVMFHFFHGSAFRMFECALSCIFGLLFLAYGFFLDLEVPLDVILS